MDSKLSIIIPTYNSESYIKDCLKSILNSTYLNLEIIVVDDCSNDDTLSIVEEVNKLLNNKIIVYKNDINRGPGFCRELGVKLCTGN